jgi:predicted dehydrogenase
MQICKVGVVGVGHLGEVHLKKFLAIPEAELAGFWDADDNVRNSISKSYGVKAFDSLESLFEAVEAVSIVVPTSAHAEIATAAAAKGVNLFVEKPIAADLKGADTIIEAAHSNGVKLQVGHIERFNAAYRSLRKDLINPRFIESHRLASFNSRGLDVSVILDLMIHDLDLIFQLMPSPLKRVDTNGVAVVSSDPKSFDIVNARLTFEDGAVANVTASRISQKKMRKMRLFQQDSYMSMDFVTGEAEKFRMVDPGSKADEKGLMTVMSVNHGDTNKHVGYKKYLSDGKDALVLELSSFLESIRNDTEPAVTGEQARTVLAAALDIAEKTGANPSF